nr:UbiA family prenyltransferase [Pelagicoccus albus]
MPTVWSNILCAWIIVGGYEWLQFASYAIGGTLLYTGGMYLNDYFDREFDSEFRPERPIPSQQISPVTVRNIAAALLLVGFAGFAWTGLLPAAFAAGIVACIVIYDFSHKGNAASPLFMAACRALLYLAVASSYENGIDTYNLIATGTIFTFILGVTYLARGESTTNAIDYPALAMAAAPVLGAFYYRSDYFDAQRGAVLALFAAWNARSFLRARVDGELIIGKTIGPLLASIPILDLLILSTLGLANQTHLIVFVALFALTATAQKTIPAS